MIEAGRHYVYRIIKDGVTVYVGKGSGARFTDQKRRFGCDGEIVQWFKTDSEAYIAEEKMIAELRPALNKTSGGEGARCRRVRLADDPWLAKITVHEKLSPTGLAAWMETLCLDRFQASAVLDIEFSTLDRYLSGETDIPQVVALACAAIAQGVPAIK